MSQHTKVRGSLSRARWSAIGAAVAVCLGAGGIGVVSATTSSGERSVYQPITPCRLADTRPGDNTVGSRTLPIGPGETYELNAWGAIGDCTDVDLPDGITALSLNVTALKPTERSFLTFFPGGEALPNASHLNPDPAVVVPLPNAVTVDLNATGDFSVYNFVGSVHVIIDVVGVYDDHDHDDRYVPRDEVEASLNAKADAADVYTKTETDADNLWAVVNADGTLARGSNVTATTGNANGSYTVTFNRDVTQCAFVATVGNSGLGVAPSSFIGTAQLNADNTGVFLRVHHDDGNVEEAPFHLIVQC